MKYINTKEVTLRQKSYTWRTANIGNRGLYIGKYPPGGKNISQCHLGEKYEKVKRKRGKCKRKGRKWKENEEIRKKMRKGEVKE
jgi:hypothetical protein